ncbi:MAG: TA system VapC family ribonuclease toxin [Acidobacteriota bacterium]
MILIDANLLIYASDRSSSMHERARRWLETTLPRPQPPIRLAWITVLAFLRITTNPRVFENPFAMGEAVSCVSEWLAQPAVEILQPGERYWAILQQLLSAGQIRAPLVMDAHLAALAIEHGATLCTTDKDFARFEALRLLNPLEKE